MHWSNLSLLILRTAEAKVGQVEPCGTVGSWDQEKVISKCEIWRQTNTFDVALDFCGYEHLEISKTSILIRMVRVALVLKKIKCRVFSIPSNFHQKPITKLQLVKRSKLSPFSPLSVDDLWKFEFDEILLKPCSFDWIKRNQMQTLRKELNSKLSQECSETTTSQHP